MWFGKKASSPERQELEAEREKTRVKRGQVATKIIEYKRLELLMLEMLRERQND